MWVSAKACLKRHPIAANVLLASSLHCAGDCIAQAPAVAKKEERFDARRTLYFGLYGGICAAPTQYYWFGFMEKYVGAGMTAPMRQAMARVCVHSLVYAPFSIATLFMWMAALHASIASILLLFP